MNVMRKMGLEPCLNQAAVSFFDLYHKDSFKQDPRVTWIDGWKIEYMAITNGQSDANIPTLIIGGAFQNFNSYKYCVEQLFEKGPVILIDLPSLGNNQQIHNLEHALSVASLSLPDLSQLLGQWLDLVEQPKVAVMGLSLGSVVASCLAHQRPELVDRMILMGVMQKTRQSWRMLLEESLFLMQEQRMHAFGQAVVLYLVNHAKLQQTRMSPTAKRLFYKQMSQFGTAEQLRYEINCKRLLNLKDVPIPQGKTLVACGQYDSFTLPYENANFALQCPDMQFALICNADHLPQLQRRKETMNLFTAFLKDQDLSQVEGIQLLDRQQMQQMQRRGEPRITVDQSETQLRHRHLAFNCEVRIVNINYFGVYLSGSYQALQSCMADYERDLSLVLQDENGEFAVECLIFEQDQHGIRALFKHGCFEIAERLQQFLQAQNSAVDVVMA